MKSKQPEQPEQPEQPDSDQSDTEASRAEARGVGCEEAHADFESAGDVREISVGRCDDWPAKAIIAQREPRNLLVLALSQIVFRVGWVFKTESVVMPALIDYISGPFAGLSRGLLPVLNRFGQSFPPTIFAKTLRCVRFKGRMTAGLIVGMATVMGVLAWVCYLMPRGATELRPAALLFRIGVVLTLYFIFCVFCGLFRVSSGTLKGKLISPNRRGRLLRNATFWGSIPAGAAVLVFLPGWLAGPVPAYFLIFAFSAVCFAISAVVLVFLAEPGDEIREAIKAAEGGHFRELRSTLRADPNLRRLVWTATLFGLGMIVLPHYQAAREQLGLESGSLAVWVVVQVSAVGMFSLIVGPLADRYGNRLTLLLMMFGSVLGPLLAGIFLMIPTFWGGQLYWLVYVSLALQPLVLRIMGNYTLEICSTHWHSRYLATVSLCQAIPFLFSPLIGWAVHYVGLQLVMFITAGALLLAGLMTLGLEEPRHAVRARDDEDAAEVTSD